MDVLYQSFPLTAYKSPTADGLLFSITSLCSHLSMVSSCWTLLHIFFSKTIGILSLTKPKGPFPHTPNSKAGRDVPGRTWVHPGEKPSPHCTNPGFRSDLGTTHYLTTGLKNRLRLKIAQCGQLYFLLSLPPPFPVPPCNRCRNVIAALCNCCRNNLSCHWLTLFTPQEKLADQSHPT